MIIGIDFDNTIASYDEPMHRTAVAQGLIPAALPKNKKRIRDAIRALEDGESKWRALQVHSYGPGMPVARAMDGVKDFIAACKQRGLPVRIVSHKTEFANFGAPGVNLREAALRWLDAEGFVDSGNHGVGRAHIYFEGTREEKIERIRALGITHFVDDLEETFLEPSFPAGVEQILYAPQGEDSGAGRWRAFRDWPAIQQQLLGGAPQEDLAALASLIAAPVESAERIGAGRNSRVYKVRAGGRDYAAKFYFKPTADGRDRLQVEFGALKFLWGCGLRDIAEPLLADPARQLAIYQYLPGEPVAAAAASADDVAQLVAYVAALKKISARPETAGAALGPAAEAFFTTEGVVGNLRQRLARLEALQAEGPSYDALRRFLKQEFAPALEAWSARAQAAAPGELEPAHRTLSASDLGFHNALRRPDGRLAFLDLEYFGWDDPAKTLSDCLLHPLMGLAPGHRARLRAGFDEIFGTDPRWQTRVKALYPLFALKWCMILLNEFRQDQIERRRYVDRKAEEIQVIQMRQLEAARKLLERTQGELAG